MNAEVRIETGRILTASQPSRSCPFEYVLRWSAGMHVKKTLPDRSLLFPVVVERNAHQSDAASRGVKHCRGDDDKCRTAAMPREMISCKQRIVHTWAASAEGFAARLKPLTSNSNFLPVPSASCVSDTRLEFARAF